MQSPEIIWRILASHVNLSFMTKGRQLSSLKGIDLSSKLRDEVRNHEKRKLFYLGLDVIQFLVNFFLCLKRFCYWFDLGDMNSPLCSPKKVYFDFHGSDFLRIHCYCGSLICLVLSCYQELWKSLTYQLS